MSPATVPISRGCLTPTVAANRAGIRMGNPGVAYWFIAALHLVAEAVHLTVPSSVFKS